MTMQLCFSPTSPYARKVLMVAMEKGIAGELDITPMATFTTESDIWDKNPLGKVPALTTREGTVLCNSPVICDYLDNLSGENPLTPKSGDARWQAANYHALADGIMDASIQRTVEKRLRPEDKKWAEWHEIQNVKITKALQFFEEELTAGRFGKAFEIGEIALACALAYLDFRYGNENWRNDCPALTKWFEEISRRPSFIKTSPPQGS